MTRSDQSRRCRQLLRTLHIIELLSQHAVGEWLTTDDVHKLTQTHIGKWSHRTTQRDLKALARVGIIEQDSARPHCLRFTWTGMQGLMEWTDDTTRESQQSSS